MRQWNAFGLLPVLALAAADALACYTVYDAADRVVYHSEKAPVDMSRPLHQTVPARFPGGHLVFDARECGVMSSVAMGEGGIDLKTESPVLTEERTARALRVPYRALPQGAAVIQPHLVSMPPALTIIRRGDRQPR